MSDGFEATTNGVVASIDQDLARVLIGDAESEWFFPMQTLPAGVKVGSDLLFTEHDGRYSVLGFARSAGHTAERSIEDRLRRPISQRRTLDMHLDPEHETGHGTADPPS